MAKFRPKAQIVEARKYDGAAGFTVMHDIKGEQHAKKGDWLVGSEKGQIEVLSDAAFHARYEPVVEEQQTEE